MAQAYPLCSSPSSAFCDITTRISSSASYSLNNLKFPNFHPSRKLSLLNSQSKPFLHPPFSSSQDTSIPKLTQAVNSLEDAKLDDPDAKSSPLSKTHIWVNPRNPKAKRHWKNSHDAIPSLAKLAKSLNSCHPSEQHVSEILKGNLGDNVTERDAVLILNNMVNPDNALLVFKYFQKFESVRHVILYNVTMKLFRETREFERAEKLFEEMLQRGVKPDLITFSTMISCATLCSMPHKAVEWFEMMPSFECEPNDNLSSLMISSYARTGNVDMALKLYDRAKKDKWHIDTGSFSTLIMMYGKSGNYDGCISVYNDMKVLGAKPNMATYNNLLHAMGKAKRAWKAKAIYEEMINNGISPNQSTYAAVLQAYCRGRYKEDALIVYKEMKAKGKDMDTFLYNMLLDMCADVGYADEAVEIFEDMKSSGTCQPDSFTYSSLIKMYGKSGNYDGCISVYNDMKFLGAKPNVVTYNNLLNAMGRAKRAWKVKAIYKEMKNNGVSPNQLTYAAVLQAYCRARYMEDALIVYKEMKEKGMDMDTFQYNMLLDMCADVGYADEAVEIFEDMKRSGSCQPDSFTHSNLIKMYACSGKVSEAEAMLNEMISCGFEPNIFVLTMFVHCYGKAKRTDDVVKIFNQFWDLGISPDDRLCDCLLHVMTQIPKQEHGKITDCIEKANPKLGNVVSYLMEEKEGDGDFRKEALELLNSVDDDVKKYLCNSLIDLCVSLGVQHRARDLLDLGLTLEIYKDIQSRTETQWSLHLKKLSVGAAMTALHVWIDELSKAFESGEEVPPQLAIYTGPWRRYKCSDKELASVLESYLKELNAPFHKATNMAGWVLATNQEAKSWLQSRGSTETVAALNSTV